MYLTANVSEGEIFNISDIKLSGNLIITEEDMHKLVTAKPAEVFSRAKLEKSAQQMTAVLANIGYAFAQVTPIPTVDRANKTVAINFFVNPGKRVYVRYINIKGNHSTQDEVIRREMRQLEGAWYSQAAIDRSKVRLQRLGFFKKVEITTPKVAGSEDQVDVVVTVDETTSGAFTFGLGYSQVYGIVLSASVSQNNFLGTGDRASITASKSDYLEKYDLSYYQPYLTTDGIGLGYDISYAKLDQAQANLANYLSDTAAFSSFVGIPVSENDTVNLQLGINKTKIITSFASCAELDVNGNCVADANGNPITYQANYSPQPIVDYIQALNHNTFHEWTLQASWAHDTRNKYFNPTHGSFQQFSAEVALPGSTVEYYKLVYRYMQYVPITSALTFEGSATIGYGNSYRDADGVGPNGVPIKVSGLPFFENFYAGGISDVRSFRDNTLGPFGTAVGCGTAFDSSYCRQPFGGNLKTVGSAEIIFPTPFVKDDTTTRLSWYLDAGNVFNEHNHSLGNVNCIPGATSPVVATSCIYDNGSFSLSDLRVSTGFSLHWQAPVGPIVINIGRPIRSKPGDIGETLQFNFGSTF
jgi:outer membrane protein insertion porin family